MRWSAIAIIVIISGLLGWMLALHAGIDWSRIPEPPFRPGQQVAVVRAALAASDPAELRDARFAHHNGIDISTRIQSGRIQTVQADEKYVVEEVDIDLARLRPVGGGRGFTIWLAVDALRASGKVSPPK